MAEIVAEFSYWSYGGFSQMAMVPRPEVTAPDVEKISRRYAVKAEVSQRASYFLMISRMPSRYRKTVVKVMGNDSEEIRRCIREIILVYGRPDEVPFSLTTAKRIGKAIVDSLLREYPGR